MNILWQNNKTVSLDFFYKSRKDKKYNVDICQKGCSKVVANIQSDDLKNIEFIANACNNHQTVDETEWSI